MIESGQLSFRSSDASSATSASSIDCIGSDRGNAGRIRRTSGVKRILAQLAAIVLAASGVLTARAQNSSTPTVGDVFASGDAPPTYSDEFSSNCEKTNDSPYAGMNPLTCYGVMAPVDSNGRCTLSGLRIWKQVGNTCYYCKPIDPPIKGFIVPIDDIRAAYQQRFSCGANQTDPKCSVICIGSGTFTPPPGTILVGSPGNGNNSPTNPPSSNKPPLQGYITNTPNPCEPFGPSGYDYCKNPAGTKLPAGCVCPKTGQPGGNRPSNPVQNAGQYIQGLVAGVGQCAKGFGDLLAGADAFMQGNYADAAQLWGLSPGQSVTLKLIQSELSTPVVGSNITPYEQGVTAGRRICAYGIVPGVAKAGGTVLKSATAGARANPISGSTLLEATTNDPASLANKWVTLPKGPVQLGNFIGDGAFGAVYDYGENNVIKISTNNEGSAASFSSQVTGSQRLRAVGVSTPRISDYQPGGPLQPSALIEQNVTKQWPGAQQYTPQEYLSLPPAERTAMYDAINNATNKIAAAGYVWADSSLNNMMFQQAGATFNLIVHDSDLVMTIPEIEEAFQNLSTSVPAKVIYNALEGAGDLQALSPGYTAESLQASLRNARIGGAPMGGDTVPGK